MNAVAVCPIPEVIRREAIQAVCFQHDDMTLREAIVRALHVASLERARFGMTDKHDAEVKEAVRLYISTWLIPPLLVAMKRLEKGGEV